MHGLGQAEEEPHVGTWVLVLDAPLGLVRLGHVKSISDARHWRAPIKTYIAKAQTSLFLFLFLFLFFLFY